MKKFNVATIDIGTNSFHLIVVEVSAGGNFKIIDRLREVIRLNEGMSGDIKYLTPSAIERGVLTLKRFKKIANSYNAEIKAVATSAVREAINKNEFIERVYREIGIEIEIINGEEEARLIYTGILRALPVVKNQILSIDIGGGSTEFSIGKNGKLIYAFSIKLGAVRLTNMFFPDFELTTQGIQQCRQWIRGTLFPIAHKLKNIGFEAAVGTSGTILSVAALTIPKKKKEDYSSQYLNNYKFNGQQLFKVEKKILSRKLLNERVEIKGLDAKRAEILPAGIIILSEIFKLLELKEMTVSNFALREGALFDYLQKKGLLKDSVSLFVRKNSIRALMNSHPYDKKHCKHVSRLAKNLFQQTKNLHNLKPAYVEYLKAAAKLHDIGYVISHHQHHRHSLYIIKNHGLLGFSENEVQIIANVARYHRKSHPKETHSDFAQLSERDQNIVRKLSALLRLADSLDRTHQKLVKKLKMEKKGDYLLLTCFYENEYPEIELWNAERRKYLFEQVFGLPLKIKAKPLPEPEKVNNKKEFSIPGN